MTTKIEKDGTKKQFPIINIDKIVDSLNLGILARSEIRKLLTEREKYLKLLFKAGVISYNEVIYYRRFSKHTSNQISKQTLQEQIDLLIDIAEKRKKGKGVIEVEVVGSSEAVQPISKIDLFSSSLDVDKYELQEDGLEAIREISEFLNEQYSELIERIKLNENIPEEVKITYLNNSQSKIKIGNFLLNYKFLLSRFIERESQSDGVTINEFIVKNTQFLKELIKSSLVLFDNLYKDDVRIYTEIFEQFDEMIENRRVPMEIYLGRDGIYSFIGRRAQQAVRRSERSYETQNNPRYLVFPRPYTTKIDLEFLNEYLERNDINAGQDLIFIDTGYVGTIPEFIFTILGHDVLGKDSDYVKDRIRLIKNISDRPYQIQFSSNENLFKIAQEIEDSPKDTKTSQMLRRELSISDQGVTERLVPHEAPSGHDEQFRFKVMKQILARHFYIMEKIKSVKKEE